MDPATIQQIATEVVARLPFGDRYLVVMALVSALVGALAALGTSYFKTRGQNLATKHDFDELLKQQEATAEAVEVIKSEVSQRDWAQREWMNLRRIKLEALLEKMHECETYLDRCRSAANRLAGAKEGAAFDQFRPAVFDEFSTIADMYFQELRKETNDFVLECRQEAVAVINLGLALLGAGDDIAARQRASHDFEEAHWPPPETI
jgi:hypothetical protein